MMNLDVLTEFFGWASVISIVYMMITFLLVIMMRDWITTLHAKWFKISVESLETKYFDFLSNYKIITIVFCFTPYLALKIMGH